LPPADLQAVAAELQHKIGRPPTERDVLSYLLYPKVFTEYVEHQDKYSDTSVLSTDVFLYGLEPQQEVPIDIERGKQLIVKFLTVGDPHPDGRRTVFFELNGQPRSINIRDFSLETDEKLRVKADPSDPLQVGAPMPGLVVTVAVNVGDAVKLGEKLLTLEAMKMETTIYAEEPGKVKELLVHPGTQVETNDLLLRFEPAE
jgi:pyruvate carboxylase